MQRLVEMIFPKRAAAVWRVDCGIGEDTFGGEAPEEATGHADPEIATAAGPQKLNAVGKQTTALGPWQEVGVQSQDSS